jgi:hypothetical protein
VPSTSIVSRGSAKRLTTSITRSWFSWTKGASVVWVNWRSQLPTVRAVGIRAKRQAAEAGDEGIPTEIAEVLQPTGPHVEQRHDEQDETASPRPPVCGE